MTATATRQSETVEDIDTNRHRLLDQLNQELEDSPVDWQAAFIKTVASWPKENERVHGAMFHYFIGEEAFNWKRLAELIATRVSTNGDRNVTSDRIFEWIDTTGVFGGISEQEFRRILGVDAWRAHLNYFYGVHIEQCLIAAIQSRIQKRRYASGMPPSDDASERAYLGLYEETEQTLWDQFLECNSVRLAELIAESPEKTRTIALDEEFTYWLFKKRIEHTNAPQIAAETQRGLAMLNQIRSADERRNRMLKDQNGGDLLEFKLVKPRRKSSRRKSLAPR